MENYILQKAWAQLKDIDEFSMSKSLNESLIESDNEDVEVEVSEEGSAWGKEDGGDTTWVWTDEMNEEDDDDAKEYIGQVVLECNICHGLVFKNEDEIKFEDGDEDADECNFGDLCPYCQSENTGYKIVGQIVPFDLEEEEDDDDGDEDDIESSNEEDFDGEESLDVKKKLTEAEDKKPTAEPASDAQDHLSSRDTVKQPTKSANVDDLAARTDVKRQSNSTATDNLASRSNQAQQQSNQKNDAQSSKTTSQTNINSVQHGALAGNNAKASNIQAVGRLEGGSLKQGASGDNIKALQNLLLQRGYDTRKGFKDLKASGTFDDLTKQAVMQFQKDNGLTVDGIVGKQTMAALQGKSSYQAGGIDSDTLKKVKEIRKQTASANSDTLKNFEEIKNQTVDSTGAKHFKGNRDASGNTTYTGEKPKVSSSDAEILNPEDCWDHWSTFERVQKGWETENGDVTELGQKYYNNRESDILTKSTVHTSSNGTTSGGGGGNNTFKMSSNTEKQGVSQEEVKKMNDQGYVLTPNGWEKKSAEFDPKNFWQVER